MAKVYVVETDNLSIEGGECLGVATSLERAKAMIERRHTPGLVWHRDEHGWFSGQGENIILEFELDGGDDG